MTGTVVVNTYLLGVDVQFICSVTDKSSLDDNNCRQTSYPGELIATLQ